jgi:DNA-binding MarR family transcriptional regulator
VIEARLAAAQGLSEADGHALAGFLDAEGSFGISPNNDGRTWSCHMSAALRLDDGDVVSDLCRCTGLGRVFTTRARRTSRPQATWSIASKRECAELVRILRHFPLRARKRRDFEIWAQAVDRWSAVPHGAPPDAGFHAAMARDAERLRAVRRYVNTPPPAVDGSEAALLAYLGGFFSGEGCFGLSRLQPRAAVKLRQDDRSILELFASRFGVGLVRDRPARAGDNPTVTWLICATRELPTAICLFEAAQLRGRKRREFEVWRQAAHERAGARLARRPWDRPRVERVAGELAAMRAYRHPAEIPAATRSAADDDARRAYAQVLRAFADEMTNGALTCTAYAQARERHPEWPTRNTIALAFGGWTEALRAAGVGSRLSARSRTIAASEAGAGSSGTRTSWRQPIGDNISAMGQGSAQLAPPAEKGPAAVVDNAEPQHADDAQPLSADLCWLLSRASYTLTTELTKAFEELGLSPRANCVLSAAMTGDHTQSEVARMVGLDKTTMVVTLDELEAAGLAERRPSPHDRRARVIGVTASGKRKVREAEEIAERVRADVLSVLPERDREVFLNSLTRLVSGRLAEPVTCSQPVRRRAPRS